MKKYRKRVADELLNAKLEGKGAVFDRRAQMFRQDDKCINES